MIQRCQVLSLWLCHKPLSLKRHVHICLKADYISYLTNGEGSWCTPPLTCQVLTHQNVNAKTGQIKETSQANQTLMRISRLHLYVLVVIIYWWFNDLVKCPVSLKAKAVPLSKVAIFFTECSFCFKNWAICFYEWCLFIHFTMPIGWCRMRVTQNNASGTWRQLKGCQEECDRRWLATDRSNISSKW